MFIIRYRSIDLIFISCCFIINLEAQNPDYKYDSIVDIKKGINLVNQDSLSKKDSTNFNLKLNKISWFNSSKNSTNINLIPLDFKGITVPYDNAYVKFEFTYTNFLDSNKSKFKYKINELYSSWRPLEESNDLTFIHLPPGDYVLEILYSTGSSSWNLKTLKIPIIVNQIYYKKWWFIIAFVCFIIFLLFYIRKYEMDHINKLEALRLRISRDLHDELGSTLTGIAIKSDLLLEKIDLRSKKIGLSEISEQSRNAVDTLSDIVWAIDSNNNSILKLSERMESILYQLLTPLNIKFTLQSHQNKKALLINQDHRHHVFLIFKEAITNIMKHSNASHVFVTIITDNNKLNLTIKDNGSKITQEIRSLNGNGIKNMKLRAKKINGKIQFIYNEGFTVKLSFNYVDK